MVFVVQDQPGKNLLPAKQYGELVLLLTAGSQITLSAGYVTNVLLSKLSAFCDDDFLLLIGDPVAIGIATAVACHWNQGRAKLLKWDKMEHRYYEVQINLFSKKGAESDELQ